MLILAKVTGTGAAVYDALINGQGTNGPNMYIKFDETSGTVMNATGVGGAPRTAGSYNDTFTVNQAGVPNDGGPSVDFGGTGFGAILGVGEYGISEDLSFSAWININSLGSFICMYHYGDNAGGVGNIGWNTGIDATGHLNFTAYDGSWHTKSSTTALSTGTDYHVAWVFDPGNEIRFFVNGALTNAVPSAQGYGPTSDTSISVGALKESLIRNYRFNGRLDNLCTFKELLSDQDILDQYNAGT